MHDSWHQHKSAKPFIETLITLLEEDKLTDQAKPSTYDQFIKQLEDACLLGDSDSKEAISSLAPQMVTALKKNRKPKTDLDQWEQPDIAIEGTSDISAISVDYSPSDEVLSPDLYNEIITSILGPQIQSNESNLSGENSPINIDEACANLIMDMDHISEEAEPTCTVHSKISTLLKHSQPYRECPSKDRLTLYGRKYAI